MSTPNVRTRIGIFLILSFAISWTCMAAIIRTGMSWGMIVMCMWGPGIAALATGLLTRRPLSEFGWRPGRSRYLAAGYLMPMAYAWSGYLLVWLTGLGGLYNERLVREISGALGLRGSPDWIPLAIGYGVTITLISALGPPAALREYLRCAGVPRRRPS